jgi:hypothetical protein
MKKNTFDPFMINNFSNITKRTKSTSVVEENSNSDFVGMTFIEKSMSIRTPKAKSGLVLLIESESMGEENELGKKLMRDFFISILSGIEFPEYIIFVNTGVKILDDVELKQTLKLIKKYGTNLIASHESVEFLGVTIENKLAQKWSVGDITMLIMNANKVIRI